MLRVLIFYFVGLGFGYLGNALFGTNLMPEFNGLLCAMFALSSQIQEIQKSRE